MIYKFLTELSINFMKKMVPCEAAMEFRKDFRHALQKTSNTRPIHVIPNHSAELNKPTENSQKHSQSAED